ncbi:MAG: tRNA (N(6)-L-threonylcarbamoyladenosine(37)-C(2))-methylthiotransferase MtaB [Actinomycetota bacterium]|nr:tRNA (N(6)-L-threonylcarbamoyladenosine(37)-C(2))-methylthiotransferase MtaB [Actinomycetota bacterium]
MHSYYIHTLGCKVNQAESDLIMAMLAEAGYHRVELNESPQWCILNTCTVTAHSDKKVRQAIRKIKKTNPGSKLAVIGCYPVLNREKAIGMGADFTAGNQDKLKAVNFIVQNTKNIHAHPVHEPPIHSRPLIKVQDGCRQFCSYCIVPIVRGPYYSRPSAEIIDHINKVAGQGFEEVVLTGIHIGKYGVDLTGGYGLGSLLEDILSHTGIKRVRISSMEIGEVSPDLIELMAGIGNRICRHLHLPLQSGSNKVLRLMNRPYSCEYFLEKLTFIQEKIPNIAVTTDIMVGFPGEDDLDFEHTMAAVRQAGFAKLHVFKYSKRANTKASFLKQQVDEGTKKYRSQLASGLGRKLRAQYIEKQLGQTLEVVLEKCFPHYVCGMSENYIQVFFELKREAFKGKIYRVTGEKMHRNGIWGTIDSNLGL